MNRFKKFAIVYRWEIKENTGGPSGYLNNLRKGFENNGDEIDIYSLKRSNKSDNLSILKGKLRTVLEKNKYILALFLLYFEIKSVYNYMYKLNWSNKTYFDRAHEKKFLQFESVEDLYDFRKKFKYKGITILTPHRPEPFFLEKINEIKSNFRTKYNFPLLKLVLKHIEKRAYAYTDAFIFPSSEAMSLYNEFPGFEKGSKGKTTKFVFTGSPMTNPTISAEEYRVKIGVKVEEKVIAFIGRHNEVKGYDLLTKAFYKIHDNNTKVVCAGPLSEMEYPDSTNWIELGKINDPYNLINSADIVVLPNRNTYFDLIAIETLAQGKVIIASSTGGNISLSKFSTGVVLFKSEDINDFINKINQVLQLSKDEKAKYEQDNKNLFLNYCTPEKFSYNYLQAVSEIIESRLNE